MNVLLSAFHTSVFLMCRLPAFSDSLKIAEKVLKKNNEAKLKLKLKLVNLEKFKSNLCSIILFCSVTVLNGILLNYFRVVALWCSSYSVVRHGKLVIVFGRNVEKKSDKMLRCRRSRNGWRSRKKKNNGRRRRTRNGCGSWSFWKKIRRRN